MSHATIRRCLTAGGVVLALLLGLTIGPLTESASATALETSIADSVYWRMNAERTVNGLPQLRMNAALVKSATQHNWDMYKYDTLSHQLPNEASVGARITGAGYRWSYAGENVAWTGWMDLNGALSIQAAMYNEQAPSNPHRLNILNPRFTNVGVMVLLDWRHRKLWITEDFGRPG